MHCVRKVTDDIYWVGCNDRKTVRFENIHPIPEGTSYNSYLLLDEKTVLFDTTEWEVGRQFLENLDYVLNGRTLDYVVVQHIEPDHGATLTCILEKYPNIKVICTAKAEQMIKQFKYDNGHEAFIKVKDGEEMSFGQHTFKFMTAPMVHWPEVMVSYDFKDKVLFSADAFGSFGALNGKIFSDEVQYERDFEEYARRYYSNIVGKYGPQTQNLLKKAANLDINYICSLHGLVFRGSDVEYIIDKYNKWSTYTPEEKGALIVYASMYGGTENAAEIFAATLAEKGMTNFEMYDCSSTHTSTLISKAFKYSHIAIFCVTYNLRIFPEMYAFVEDMAALNLQKRIVSIFENGSWAPQAGGLLRGQMEKMKNMVVLDDVDTIVSSVSEENREDVVQMAERFIETMEDKVCVCMDGVVSGACCAK